MRNNKGFGKFEIMTVIVLLLVVFAGGAYMLLNGTKGQKISTMKENAWSFSKVVATNIASFHYSNTVYLGEAIDEGFFQNIKNPFGGGNCDVAESRIDTIDGKPYATLKCGSYLIDQSSFEDKDNVSIYEVSEWKDKKDEEDAEERTFYNCLDGDKEVFDQYYEELYFVYQYNKEFGTDYYFAEGMPDDNCVIDTKVLYRTKNAIEEK